MEGKVRVSIMALLSRNVTFNDIQPFIRKHLGPDREREYRRIYAATDCVDDRERAQIKYSRVIDARNLDEAAILRIANAFRDAGYGDVAWKITPIAPEDTDPEKTTASFPVELFQACLDEDDDQDAGLPDVPPEPFGSDAFWKWFDEGDH